MHTTLKYNTTIITLRTRRYHNQLIIAKSNHLLALHVDMGRTSTDVGREKLRTLAPPPGASLGPAPFFFPKEPLPRAGAIGNLDRAKAARHHRPAPHKQPGLPSQVDALPCTFMLQARDFCWCEPGADSWPAAAGNHALLQLATNVFPNHGSYNHEPRTWIKIWAGPMPLSGLYKIRIIFFLRCYQILEYTEPPTSLLTRRKKLFHG
jgi:hypothetical protein